MRRAIRGVCIGVLFAGITSCVALVSLDDLVCPSEGCPSAPGGDAGHADGDSDVMADGASDAGTKDGSSEAGAPDGAVSIIAHTGVATATGNAQQHHIVYAEGAQRWWLFYIDVTGPQELRTVSSADFRVWTPGATLVLNGPHANEGRNFSVAYAHVGSADVVHVAFSAIPSGGARGSYHARAVITGDSIAFSAPVQLSQTTSTSPELDPDGPAVGITANGFIVQSTGWGNMAGADAGSRSQQSPNLDTGGSWTVAWGGGWLSDVGGIVNARGIVPLGDRLFVLSENGLGDPDATNVDGVIAATGSWTTFANLFQTAPMHANDWGAAATDTDVSLVRRRTDNSFEHARVTATSAKPGEPLVAEDGKPGSGVVVLSHAGSLAAVALSPDPDDKVRIAIHAPGGTWSTWSTLVNTPGNRAFLSGCDGSKPAIIWTEGQGGSYDVVGMPVSF